MNTPIGFDFVIFCDMSVFGVKHDTQQANTCLSPLTYFCEHVRTSSPPCSTSMQARKVYSHDSLGTTFDPPFLVSDVPAPSTASCAK